jgi:abnormal spindle-like microcephaly-associated protein
MRDGIRLGHLVQLLLQKASGEGQPVATLTESLKYPAQTSAHKLNNCSVALSEIQRLPNLPVDFIIHTKAIDIVNGHRERTIGILWLLLVHYGMSSLVDWCQLQSEVVRCQSKLKTGEHPRSLFVDSDLEASSCRTYWHKLLEWASVCAQLQGVEVSNLTSSFAGPAAFDAIINTYYPLFPTHFQSFVELQLPGTRGTASMKLRAIGCSGPFVELMCQNQSSSIPTADFTLTCLVFLAGRLLPAAKFNAAACIIQQKYRKHLGYQRSLKRIALVRLAQACSAVISAQQQVKEEEERQRKAAVVLQRTWRRILNSTCEQFHGDIKKLQTMARGFVVRRREAIVTWRRTRPSYVARREEEAALQAARNRYQDERHQRLRYFQTHELDGPEGEERREARAVARWTLEAYRTEEA